MLHAIATCLCHIFGQSLQNCWRIGQNLCVSMHVVQALSADLQHTHYCHCIVALYAIVLCHAWSVSMQPVDVLQDPNMH